ncbi:Phospho-N-acetylmuramoyl-pentapeptide-transferase [Paludibacter propionicigenes WB4]|uniref:Phospho-N-acetylmuramoyl-pentapeptide-transferase n=1 Tax=Paludibacter propionicigenes (strain DSM 17365 / JCM 13257 / WB4) TaxID=694427 RepID=E4T4K4_PALPW|nr:phospho-N-acetylmuramoyl-pentapeptide-transferase [Paludibacter propionicigenes]ADQ79648.1 Phospho-N-acetylmuramoyl-pentapeptide-transferase [Paludibacter propionicigenes WB4]
MLYHLFQFLESIYVFPGAHLFNYISFRTGLAFILALLLSTMLGRRIIDYLQKKQIGETIRDLGLEGQMSKKGTPTMGGVIIIIAILVPTLLLASLTNTYVILMLITTVWLGLIGFLDDYIKVFLKNKEGLSGRFKIVGQVGLGLIVGMTMYLSSDVVIRENIEVKGKTQRVENVIYSKHDTKSTKTTIPFVKNNNLNYADAFRWAGVNAQRYGWILFVLVAIFIVTAISNGANLTDGLDGLATGSSAIIGVILGILAYVSGNVNYAGYLNIMYLPGTGEMLIFAGAFIGATIGFLWYNAYPAQVFMGDTGSLTLGGIIAVFAIAIRKELLIPILCGVFIIENLSVVLQVGYFKYTKRRFGEGRRMFKMAPLHHHYQKPGNAGIVSLFQRPINAMPESRIVIRFWIVGIILAAITIITLKIR